MALRPCVVVHYHEISLKGGTRPLFLRQLLRNLETATVDLGPRRIRQLTGRIVLALPDETNADEVTARVTRVFGVANCALGYQVPSQVDAMESAVERVIEGRRFETFRISARRAFKTYPLTSVELNRRLGAFVQRLRPVRVDLHGAELDIHVEVLPAETFVYADRRPGPGG
ncbi:MAG: tRNA 4-thiouridine(8) synthase ThiI, partial [Candidatus Rokuibacteriota bacterium]